jgi:hypothetical protein
MIEPLLMTKELLTPPRISELLISVPCPPIPAVITPFPLRVTEAKLTLKPPPGMTLIEPWLVIVPPRIRVAEF